MSKEMNNRIKTALKEVNPDIIADYMAEVTFDDTVNTRGMFEELCKSYFNGGEEYRKGLNDTVGTLLGMDFEALVDNVCELSERETNEPELN